MALPHSWSHGRHTYVDKDFFLRIGPENSTSIPLVSGTRFIISTDDAIERPLPDLALLAMQWHRQCILAMLGAAGSREEDLDDGDATGETGVSVRDTVERWLEDIHKTRHRSSPSGGSKDSVDGSSERTPHSNIPTF